MPVFRASLVLAATALILSACVSQAPPGCASASEKPTAELVFARVSEQAPGVSEAQFALFLREEIKPRFPDGLTVVDAQGRWTLPAGPAIHSPSKVVTVVLRGGDDERAKLEAVRAAYMRRYHQTSVLLMDRANCVAL